jgi:hypothetical protein
MLDTYTQPTPLYIFEAIASQQTQLSTLTDSQKYNLIAKLYFYTQQETANLDLCYSIANVKRTLISDTHIENEIKNLVKLHEI